MGGNYYLLVKRWSMLSISCAFRVTVSSMLIPEKKKCIRLHYYEWIMTKNQLLGNNYILVTGISEFCFYDYGGLLILLFFWSVISVI